MHKLGMDTRTQIAGVSPEIELTGLRPSDRPVKTGWIATGGIIGALAASSCCIIPLILFSLGVSGAWVGNLTALTPYKPVFITATLGFLGYGYWLVYRKPKACADADACARPLPNRLVKSALWASTALIVIALFWNWIAPVIAPIMLGL